MAFKAGVTLKKVTAHALARTWRVFGWHSLWKEQLYRLPLSPEKVLFPFSKALGHEDGEKGERVSQGCAGREVTPSLGWRDGEMFISSH